MALLVTFCLDIIISAFFSRRNYSCTV